MLKTATRCGIIALPIGLDTRRLPHRRSLASAALARAGLFELDTVAVQREAVNDVTCYVHVVRRGPVDMLHRDGTRLRIDEPAVVLYPRPLWHRLQTSETCAAELVCASIQMGGGTLNPLAHALPAPVVVPLAQTAALDATLKLLFAEAFEQHEGKQAMLDRLCEVVLIHVLRFALGAERQALGVLAAMAHPQLARALLAMHEDPARHWRVAQLATSPACRARASQARFMPASASPLAPI